jgi:DNA-binding transcriptional regulator GbsR (MarR family)
MNNKKSKNNLQIEIANIAGMLASRLSLNPTVGQIYGLLYMSPEPVSLNEMVEKLGISKGSASINVRTLESWGAVRKVWVDNSRKDYYEANPDILNIIFNRINDGVNKRLSEAHQKFKIIEKISMSKENVLGNDEFYKERLNNIKEIYSQITTLLDYLKGK